MNRTDARPRDRPKGRARAQGEFLSEKPDYKTRETGPRRARPDKRNDDNRFSGREKINPFSKREDKNGASFEREDKRSHLAEREDKNSRFAQKDGKSSKFSERGSNPGPKIRSFDSDHTARPSKRGQGGRPLQREHQDEGFHDAFSSFEHSMPNNGKPSKTSDRGRPKRRDLDTQPTVRERRGGRMRDVVPKKLRPEFTQDNPLNTHRRQGRERQSTRRTPGPWASTNLTEAHVRDAPSQRSQAELKRSTHGKEVKKERGGYKALKMQQALASVGYGARMAVKNRISTIESFEAFGLLPTVHDSISPQALKSLEQISPTPIQKLAIPALLGHQEKKRRRAVEDTSARGMEQFLLAAETGSGKTLAYLLPVIDALKRAETIDVDRQKLDEETADEKKKTNVFELEAPSVHAPHPTTGRPRVIILVPTAELVDQVGQLAKSLSHTIRFRAALISSAYSGVVVRNRLFSPSGIDLLVSTPHLLASITEADPNVLSRVSHLIIDEADSLFDRSFSPLTTKILDRATPSLKQLILCSATIPKRLDSYLRERFPDIRRLVTPNLHAIPRRVQLGIVEAEKEPYHGNKDLACADTIWSVGKSTAEHSDDAEVQTDWSRVKRIIVFVNEREKTVELADYLITKGIDAVALNRDVDLRKQGEILSTFTSSGASEKSEEKGTMNRKEARKQGIRTLPNTKVLVVTDLASRGIDTTAVKHVVLYDVPHTTIDFIHRLGRTGRMGRRGRGIVLVGKGDRKDVVKEVREGMFKGQALI